MPAGSNALWKPGQSGNPNGKPPGTRSKTAVLVEKLFSENWAEVGAAIIKAAIGGDMMAAKLIVDRIAPIAKDAEHPPLTIVNVVTGVRGRD
jgi:hypothetical protein